jgi:hypothetical protein
MGEKFNEENDGMTPEEAEMYRRYMEGHPESENPEENLIEAGPKFQNWKHFVLALKKRIIFKNSTQLKIFLQMMLRIIRHENLLDVIWDLSMLY